MDYETYISIVTNNQQAVEKAVQALASDFNKLSCVESMSIYRIDDIKNTYIVKFKEDPKIEDFT